MVLCEEKLVLTDCWICQNRHSYRVRQ